MRARWTVSASLLALAALVALPAMAEEAAETETDSADRALIHSYDPDAMQLLWATSGVDEDAEDYCNVEDGDEYTYEVVDEETGEATVEIEDKELAEACDFTATDVTGPEGQVNHGTVVSAFVHALKANGYTGIGCYVKLIAQSDYGKGDQQIQVGEDAPEATEGETELSFTLDTTRCGKPDHAGPPADKGKPDKAESSDDKGKPPWAGPKDKGPDHPGKGNGKGQP